MPTCKFKSQHHISKSGQKRVDMTRLLGPLLSNTLPQNVGMGGALIQGGGGYFEFWLIGGGLYYIEGCT